MASPLKSSLIENLPSSFAASSDTVEPRSPTSPDQHSRRHQRSSFDFFTLNNDGSTPDLIETHPPPGQRTPPAALSSLAVKMADRDMTDSTASFDTEQYDMIDDASEVSNGGYETVSIESTDEDEGAMTPEDTGSLVDAEEATTMPAAPNGGYAFEAYSNLPAEGRTDPANWPDRSAEIAEIESSYGGAESLLRQAQSTSGQGRAAQDYARYHMLVQMQDWRRQRLAQKQRDAAPKGTGGHALAEYQMQLMLLEQQNKKRLLLARQEFHGKFALNDNASREKTAAGQLKQGEAHTVLEDHERQMMLDEQQRKKRLLMARQEQDSLGPPLPDLTSLRRRHQEMRAREAQADNMLMSEDLETPRQSTYQQLPASYGNREITGKNLDQDQQSQGPLNVGAWISSLWQTSRPMLKGACVFLVLFSAISSMFFGLSYPAADLATRREALSDALVKMAGTPEATKSFNIEQLLPSPTPISTNILGNDDVGYDQVRYQGVPPNTIVISLPWSSMAKPKAIKSVEVTKSELPIAFNTTQLLDSVYALTFDPAEAHGIVTAHLVVKSSPNITVSHNFGRRFFQQQAYKKAGADLSASVNKDVATACQTAKSLSQRLHLDIGAGVAATRNVTSQLTTQMTRDLQLWASKASQARSHTSSAIRKDLAQARDEIRQAGKDLQTFFGRTTDMIRYPLTLSHERAVAIKDKLQARKVRNAKARDLVKDVKRVPAKTLDTAAAKSTKRAWFADAEQLVIKEDAPCPCKKNALSKGKGEGKRCKKAGGCTCAGAKTRPTVKPALV